MYVCHRDAMCVCVVGVLIVHGYDGRVVDVVAFECMCGSVCVVAAVHILSLA